MGRVGFGLYFAALPLYYSTLWWNDVPYYYADDNYYQWDGSAGEYETVSPPPEVESQVETQSPAVSDVFAYPKNGQSAEQQTKDRFECHRWAADQTGFDPTQPPDATSPSAPVAPDKRSDYLRAQAACLDGRGYTVK